jgi:plastocyanin
VTGHPFLIRTSGGVNYNDGLVHVSTTGVVSTGASAQGQVVGTLYWKIPAGTTGNYQYICSIHSGMVGVITIKDITAI